MMKRNYEVGLANGGNVKSGDGYRSRAVIAQTAYAPILRLRKRRSIKISLLTADRLRFTIRLGQMLRDSSTNREADRYQHGECRTEGRGPTSLTTLWRTRTEMRSTPRWVLGTPIGCSSWALAQQQKSADRYDAMARGEGPSLAASAYGHRHERPRPAGGSSLARGPAALPWLNRMPPRMPRTQVSSWPGKWELCALKEQLAPCRDMLRVFRGFRMRRPAFAARLWCGRHA